MMKCMYKVSWVCAMIISVSCAVVVAQAPANQSTTNQTRRDPARLLGDVRALANPESLPLAPSRTSTIYRAREGDWQFNLHSYITRHDGRFWAIWSSGRVHEDTAGQVVRYATSEDGHQWSESAILSEPPQTADGPGKCIARGVFVHDGKLTALVAHMDAQGWNNLRLVRFVWDNGQWNNRGVFLDDCMNNFPPRPIAGRLFMTRRPAQRGVYTALADGMGGQRWTIDKLPLGPGIERLSEPSWYIDPEGLVHMLLRVQSPRAKVLARSISADEGRTWSPAVLTDYPDATSKNYTERLSNGWYFLINNPNTAGRDPLAISFSRDGWLFDDPVALRKDAPPLRYAGRAKGSGSFQYPHAIEHDGSLWVIYATNKEDIEVSQFAVADLVPPDPTMSPLSTRMLSLLDMPYGGSESNTNLGELPLTDLGSSGQVLYLALALDGKEGSAVWLETPGGDKRVGIGLNANGVIRARLRDGTASVRGYRGDEPCRMVVKVVTREGQTPDELLIRSYGAQEKPGHEPGSDEAWTLVNREGWSDADLTRYRIAGRVIGKVRVGRTWEEVIDALDWDEIARFEEQRQHEPIDLVPTPQAIDWDELPQLKGRHAVITEGDEAWKFRLHSYLAHHDGRYWAIWSHGPRIEDHPTQHVRYATSEDGIHWSQPKALTGPSSKDGFRYIARGLWVRDGELLALASHDEAYRDGRVHFFGPSLELRAWRWNASASLWEDAGVVFDDAINNFPPKRLASGEWMMSRRSHDRHVSMLVGGVKSISDWRVVPVSTYAASGGGHLEEPYWWQLDDGALVGVFRDNARSRRLMRAFSADQGRTWTAPVRTDFPDATSKFNAVQTSRGYLAMVSNANPEGRNPLCLSISSDGLMFTAMGVLPVPGDGTFQYPHVIEQDGHLLIAYSRNKTAIEVIKVSLDEVDRMWRPMGEDQ